MSTQAKRAPRNALPVITSAMVALAMTVLHDSDSNEREESSKVLAQMVIDASEKQSGV